MKYIYLSLSLVFLSVNMFSQGIPHVKVFSNFNYDLNSNDNTNYKAFEIKRAYLGYSHNLSEDFTLKVTFDVGENNSGSTYTAFLKIASLNWKKSEKLNINFGMISTQNFKFMENSWGKRYVYKSFLDQNEWASSADLGASITYAVSDNFLFDAQLLNGDGYKNIQDSKGLMRGSAGVTYNIENISIRISRDILPRSEYLEQFEFQSINTLAFNYHLSNINLGGEYNIRENTFNVLNNTSNALSLYGTIELGNDINFFGRYDKSFSEDINEIQWNILNEGEITIIGVEKIMIENVKVALNFRTFKNATLETELEADLISSIFLNFEYKF